MNRTQLAGILSQTTFSDEDIVQLLGLTDPEDCRMLKDEAFRRTTELMGPYVYYRGLIELSNICTANCRYCGIRKANYAVKRYTMTKEEIVEQAVWAARQGYGSVCLQSGERHDEKFIEFICECLREIHQQTKSPLLPNGVGVTLSLGDQTEEVYRRWAKACGNPDSIRYLARLRPRTRSSFTCSIRPPGRMKRTSSTASSA